MGKVRYDQASYCGCSMNARYGEGEWRQNAEESYALAEWAEYTYSGTYHYTYDEQED